MPRYFANPTPRRALAVAVIAGLAMAATGACDDTPSSPTATTTLTVMLTDAPLETIQQVNVYFTGVTVKPTQGAVERLALQLPTNPVDLLTLDDRVVSLAAGLVPAGEYEFIQVDIDPVRSTVVVDGVTTSVSVPSREIKILGPFTIEGATASVTLDFDASKSLVSLGNGAWLLKPVIVRAE